MRMQVGGRGGNMENLWIMFDHVKRLKDWMKVGIVKCWQLHVVTCRMRTLQHF